MFNATHKTLHPRRTDRRRKSSRAPGHARNTPLTPKAISERFAAAMLSGDKRQMDRVLREIARTYPPSESTREFLGVLSGLLARTANQALKLHMLQEQLRNLALTDDLTGLHNRRGFIALAGQQLKFARRNREHALLFFADINGLKQINDRFGHSEGDAAINRMARVLQRTFRESDIIARLGGDEFAVLANEAGPDSQGDVWRRLKENLIVEGTRDPRFTLSASVGLARFDPRSPVTLDELLNSADRAMYEAKSSRSNRGAQAIHKDIREIQRAS